MTRKFRKVKHGDLPIVTVQEGLPIPSRYRGWVARVDGLCASPYGWGVTEREAINDLLERLKEDC